MFPLKEKYFTAVTQETYKKLCSCHAYIEASCTAHNQHEPTLRQFHEALKHLSEGPVFSDQDILAIVSDVYAAYLDTIDCPLVAMPEIQILDRASKSIMTFAKKTVTSLHEKIALLFPYIPLHQPKIELNDTPKLAYLKRERILRIPTDYKIPLSEDSLTVDFDGAERVFLEIMLHDIASDIVEAVYEENQTIGHSSITLRPTGLKSFCGPRIPKKEFCKGATRLISNYIHIKLMKVPYQHLQA
jgi:hypothetical protein